MGISTATRVEVTVSCDNPGCTTPPQHLASDRGLAHILPSEGWWVGPGDPPSPIYCARCKIALELAGKLPARGQMPSV